MGGNNNRLTQLIFSDLSTPKKVAETIGEDGEPQRLAFHNVYDDIRKKLIEKGIPAKEIQFIHDADTEAKKKELFTKARKGQVRVLLGSTQKKGAGTNIQDRLIALHDLGCLTETDFQDDTVHHCTLPPGSVSRF